MTQKRDYSEDAKLLDRHMVTSKAGVTGFKESIHVKQVPRNMSLRKRPVSPDSRSLSTVPTGSSLSSGPPRQN
jgi:hypothetical protein